MLSQDAKPAMPWKPVNRRPEWLQKPCQPDLIDPKGGNQATTALRAVEMMYDTCREQLRGRVDTDEYVELLIEHLSQAYLVDRGIMVRVSSALGVTEAGTARAIGLTLVDLVTIFVKHSLRRQPGLVAIVATRSSRHIRLRVSDDGNGQLDPFDPTQRDAFEAVRTHAVGLDAKIEVYQRPTLGSSVTVTTVPRVSVRQHHAGGMP